MSCPIALSKESTEEKWVAGHKGAQYRTDLKSVFKPRDSWEPWCAIEELGRGGVGDSAIALHSALVTAPVEEFRVEG